MGDKNLNSRFWVFNPRLLISFSDKYGYHAICFVLYSWYGEYTAALSRRASSLKFYIKIPFETNVWSHGYKDNQNN